MPLHPLLPIPLSLFKLPVSHPKLSSCLYSSDYLSCPTAGWGQVSIRWLLIWPIQHNTEKLNIQLNIQLKCAFHLEVSLFISVVEVLNTHKHNGGRYKHWKRLKMFPCKDYKQARKSPNKKTQYVHLAMPENYFLHCTILSL